MRFLVTGATGFIGGALTRHLLARGHAVRAFARPARAGAPGVPPGAETVVGDLLDRESLLKAADGVDGVFHVAAKYAFWCRDRRDLYRTNVDGAEAVLWAARRAGVRRVVATSSVGVLRPPRRGELADETSVATPDELPDDYHRSKLLAEQAALASNSGAFEVVVVNPTTPVGEGDVRPTPTGRIVLEYLGRRTPGYVETRLNVVDVDDVACGHLAAFEKGRPGERYILGGENLTLSGVYRMLGRATGLRRYPVRLPFWLLTGVAWVDEFVEGRVLRRPPYVPLAGVRAARQPMHVSCDKAIRELGLPQSSVEDALGRAAAWFAANRYVRVSEMDSARLRKKPS